MKKNSTFLYSPPYLRSFSFSLNERKTFQNIPFSLTINSCSHNRTANSADSIPGFQAGIILYYKSNVLPATVDDTNTIHENVRFQQTTLLQPIQDFTVTSITGGRFLHSRFTYYTSTSTLINTISSHFNLI